MKEKSKKVLGNTRRELILKWLKESDAPLTGGELADHTNVSRQVIVQDISLLKAKNEPVIATSQGYIYLKDQISKQQHVIACKHKPEETQKELELIVDKGVTIKNVSIEHPIYGDLTASMMVQNRRDVELFIKKVSETNASYLSELTDGTHLHTLEADTLTQIEEACDALKEAGFLVE
jgi:uncharacterized protein